MSDPTYTSSAVDPGYLAQQAKQEEGYVRDNALRASIEYHHYTGVITGAPSDDTDVVKTARKFYRFLKG